MSLLAIENVSIRFGGVNAVTDVSLTLQENSLLGFIGPNGAGKTTLMRIITGIVKPQQGRVIFQSQDITHWSIHRRIQSGLALAQQIVRPLHNLNLIDNVALAVGMRSLTTPWQALRRSQRQREQSEAKTLLALVGIVDAAEELPNTLPLGYLKRLELARALALEPKLLLLDEPLAGLNQTEAHTMADLIASFVGDNNRSVLLIEHNIREVARICPELYVQDNGRRLLQGPTTEIMNNPKLHQAYLGKEPD